MRVGSNEMDNFEVILGKTGWGLYHKFLLAIACTCAICESAALLVLPFALPIAACNLAIPEKFLQYFHVSFMCGMSMGGTLLSALSDLIGRKSLLHLTLILMFISLLGCAFSYEWIMLSVATFALGSGLAANSNIVRIFLGECLTTEWRTTALIIVDLAGSCGYVAFSVLYWWLTPYAAELSRKALRFCTFRIMFALPALPIIIIACASALLLPSPRFLLLREKFDAAIKTLQQIYTTNNNKLQEGLRLQVQDVCSFINDYGVNIYPEPHNCSEQVIYTFKKLVTTNGIIRKGNYLSALLALISLNFMISPGIFTINLWIAKSLERERNNGSSECKLVGVDLLHFESISVNKCSFDTDLAVYPTYLLVSSSIVVGKLLLLGVAPFLRRRFLLLILYVICGSCTYLLIVASSNYITSYMLSVTILLVFSSTETVLTICTIEMFPTSIRGLCAGYVKSLSYLLRAGILYSLDTSCDFILVIIGVMILMGSFFGCFLPERYKLPMVE